MFCKIDDWDCFIARLIKWCDILGVLSEPIFPFMQYLFFSPENCLLWSPCLLLIAESISLDTYGKLTVGFFLKTASSSWIILSNSLDELSSSDRLLKRWYGFFLNIFYLIAVKEFLCGKNIRGFLENLTYYFLNIIVNVNFFDDLKHEYYWGLPWNTATSKPYVRN